MSPPGPPSHHGPQHSVSKTGPETSLSKTGVLITLQVLMEIPSFKKYVFLQKP